MSGCEGCFQTQKEQNKQFTIIHAAATEFAAKNNVNVFIYKTAEGWNYMAEEPARQFGIQPTWGIIPRPVPATQSIY